jgi:hypothetical protein
MKRWLLLFLTLFFWVVPVHAETTYKFDYHFNPWDPSHPWFNGSGNSVLKLGAYEIVDTGDASSGYYFEVTNAYYPFAVKECDTGCSSYLHAQMSNGKYVYRIEKFSAVGKKYEFYHVQENTNPGGGTGGGTPPDPGGGTPPDPGGGRPGLTLPKVNLINDPSFLGTLWNYLDSVFYLGMPILLIVVALFVVELVLHMIIDIAKRRKEDDDDDDDW